jgi:MGT family glycosyltransferase
VRFVGPILDVQGVGSAELEPTFQDNRDDPLVLVSFSTSHMGQHALLQNVIDGLSSVSARVLVTTGPSVDPGSLRPASNTRVVHYLQHHSILPRTSIVVTHAGLGTVMASLSHGVPLVCIPMGRDQNFNAARVADLGAGRVLAPDGDPDTIARAVESVLGDPAYRQRASDLEVVIRRYEGVGGAVLELERLAARSS